MTDSQYLREGVTKWMAGWKRRGWMRPAKQPVKNDDLWRELDALVSQHHVRWHWVRGHSGHAENERCDELAQAEIAAIRERHSREQLRAALEDFQAERKPPEGLGELFG